MPHACLFLIRDLAERWHSPAGYVVGSDRDVLKEQMVTSLNSLLSVSEEEKLVTLFLNPRP